MLAIVVRLGVAAVVVMVVLVMVLLAMIMVLPVAAIFISRIPCRVVLCQRWLVILLRARTLTGRMASQNVQAAVHRVRDGALDGRGYGDRFQVNRIEEGLLLVEQIQQGAVAR